jgi:hypothetical protein
MECSELSHFSNLMRVGEGISNHVYNILNSRQLWDFTDDEYYSPTLTHFGLQNCDVVVREYHKEPAVSWTFRRNLEEIDKIRKWGVVPVRWERRFYEVTYVFAISPKNMLKVRLSELGFDFAEVHLHFKAKGYPFNGAPNVPNSVRLHLQEYCEDELSVEDEYFGQQLMFYTLKNNTSLFGNYFAIQNLDVDTSVAKNAADNIDSWSSQDIHFMMLTDPHDSI